MTFANSKAAKDEILTFFKDNFSGVTADKIGWPGVAFTPPTAASYIIIDYVEATGNKKTLQTTGATFSRTGIITIRCRFPKGADPKGNTSPLELADDARSVFDGKKTTNNAIFLNATLGPSFNDSNYAEVPAIITFDYEMV